MNIFVYFNFCIMMVISLSAHLWSRTQNYFKHLWKTQEKSLLSLELISHFYAFHGESMWNSTSVILVRYDSQSFEESLAWLSNIHEPAILVFLKRWSLLPKLATKSLCHTFHNLCLLWALPFPWWGCTWWSLSLMDTMSEIILFQDT